MEIDQKVNELHLYPINDNEYFGAIYADRQTSRTKVSTTVILDRSGSMKRSTRRFINDIIPTVLLNLGYGQDDDRINLITFETVTETFTKTVTELRRAKINADSGLTNFGPAIRTLHTILQRRQNRNPGEPIRVLTISDGAITDADDAKYESEKLMEFLATSELAINSQAVRLFTSNSQPDTQAMSYMLQINNTTGAQLFDTTDKSSDDHIVRGILAMFRKDNFRKCEWLHFERSIVLKFPWNSHASMRVILSPGWNIFWFREVPSGVVKWGSGNTVNVITQRHFSLGMYHELMESKLEYIADHMMILKIVGTSAAIATVHQIYECFKRQENTLALKSPTANNMVISNLLDGIATSRTNFQNSEQMADFLRDTKQKIETQRISDRKKREDEKVRIQKENEEKEKAAQIQKEKEEKETAARIEAARVEAARVEAARVEAARVEAARIEAARVEAARVEAARVEAARVEAARVEAARVEAARVEAARIQKEKIENQARIEAARLQKEKEDKDKAAQMEAARIQREKEENEARIVAARLQKEKEDEEKAAQIEADRIQEEKDTAARIQREKEENEARIEADRLQKEKEDEEMAARIEADRIQEEKDTAARIQREKEENEARIEADRLQKEKEDEEKAAQIEADRIQEEKDTAARIQREKEENEARIEADRLQKEKKDEEMAARIEADRIQEEKDTAARIQREKKENEARIEADRLQKEKEDEEMAARIEADRIQEEKDTAARIQREKDEKETAARIEATRLQKEKAAQIEAARIQEEKEENEKVPQMAQRLKRMEDEYVAEEEVARNKRKEEEERDRQVELERLEKELDITDVKYHPDSELESFQTVFIIDEHVSGPRENRRFTEKILPLMLSRLLCESSKLVHLVTFVRHKTTFEQLRQSLLQTLDARKRIRILVLTDEKIQKRQQIEHFAETLIRFLSSSNYSFELQVVRLSSTKSMIVQYKGVDINVSESNNFIAKQVAGFVEQVTDSHMPDVGNYCCVHFIIFIIIFVLLILRYIYLFSSKDN